MTAKRGIFGAAVVFAILRVTPATDRDKIGED